MQLTGCASTQISTNIATNIPVSRILDSSYLAQKPGTGAVIVKRDSIWQCPGVYIRIFVDSLPVADLRSEEKVTMYLPEGEHILGGRPNGICAGDMLNTSIIVRADKTVVVRAGFSDKGEFLFTPAPL
jgi:hypothetical protein